MSTNTQGPWIPAVNDDGPCVLDAYGYTICNLPSMIGIGLSMEEQRINAELIAMAPDLLFRLVAVVGAWRRVLRASAAGEDPIVAIGEVGTALGGADALLNLLAESGVTVGEPS